MDDCLIIPSIVGEAFSILSVEIKSVVDEELQGEGLHYIVLTTQNKYVEGLNIVVDNIRCGQLWSCSLCLCVCRLVL